MADEVVVAAEVLPGTDTQYFDGIAGATITAGQTCYLDSSDGKIKLADANASATTAAVKGIAMHGAAANQPIRLAVGGHIDPGFTVAVGGLYVQSATAGAVAPVADLASGHYPSVIYGGITASSAKLILNNLGVAKP